MALQTPAAHPPRGDEQHLRAGPARQRPPSTPSGTARRGLRIATHPSWRSCSGAVPPVERVLRR
jgi:hypothetical protein